MAECVMHLADALSFIRGRHQGVVTTIRPGGRPQLQRTKNRVHLDLRPDDQESGLCAGLRSFRRIAA
jgi:hypothetical protein